MFAPQTFTPANWYWIARNGSIYSSARNTLVTSWDPAYVAFVAQNGGTTPWPNDSSGNQTSAAMAAILSMYNIFVTPPSP
jgi:hypothetical protein